MGNPKTGRFNGSEEDLLIGKCKDGDNAAFEEIYIRYRDRILNYVYRMIGDREAAQEITQEVFISVYMNIGRYKPRGLFKAWVYTIASNLAKNELKRRSYAVNISLSAPIKKGDSALALGDVLTSKNLSAETVIENGEIKTQIENILKSLSPLYREVIILCAIEGLRYEEAAHVLKTNVKTVSSRLARARKEFIRKIEALRKK